ncbi:PAS domain S-box protein [Mucilaginibacter gilvus]|uniref:histidine kinase n=2 Tax=Mucilaginibacter gilvus TaxID=2305909 RepID=A0A3S3YXV5_9SPHI|nr:PAS domain S-box protein [Mucilaginibacter gilvus]
MPPDIRYMPSKFTTFVGLLSLFTTLIVLVGWIIGLTTMQRVMPGVVTMKANSAICFVLLGGILLLQNERQNLQQIPRILLILVTFIAGTTLLEYHLNFNAGIDELLFTDPESVSLRFPYPGRMAYNTALSLTLLGFGLLGLHIAAIKAVCQYALHAATVLAGVAIMGYVYGVSMLYSFAYVSSMAIHAALLVFLISIAAARFNPHLGVARLFMAQGVGNKMARRHFTTLMLVLLVFGSLRIQSERYHLLPPEIGISMLAISLLLTSLVMIWITANWLNKLDSERSTAELEIRDLNAALKTKVEKTEADYQSLIEHASDAIYLLNLAGDFMQVNNSTCQLTGYSRQQLLELNISALLKIDMLEDHTLQLAGIEPGRSVMVERRFIPKNGNAVDVEMNLKRIVDDRILVIARDITERKRLEYELENSAQKYKLLFESNPVPLLIVGKEDLVVVAANDAAANLYGYAPQEFQQMDIKKMSPGALGEKIVNSNRVFVEDAADFGLIEHLKKDGTRILVNIIAQDITLEGKSARLCSISDVTEKLRAQRQLLATEANLQTILNNTDSAYALLNADLDVVEYNNKDVIFAQNEFNFQPAKGKIFDLMPSEKRVKFLSHTNEVFQGNAIRYELNYTGADARATCYSVRMFPIAGKDAQILGLVLSIINITDRKVAEEDLKDAYHSISTHIGKIREMAWKQSHLIRSPLANLMGLFPMIKEDPSDRLLLGYAETELERMNQILWEMAEGATSSPSDEAYIGDILV